MYNNNEVISYLQANKILALKLDHAVSAVGHQVTNQVDILGKGATRLLYYTSCFTDEYNDVCQKQKTEDLRFRNGVIRIIQHGDVAYEMLHIYFEEIFKYKTNDQLEHIKRALMAVNVHIAASSLTGAGYALAVATKQAFPEPNSENCKVHEEWFKPFPPLPPLPPELSVIAGSDHDN